MPVCLPATDWNAISAIAAGVAAIAAIVWQLSELRYRKDVRRTELALRLDERFDSFEFRRVRVRAATSLLNPRVEDAEGEDAVYTILNFFEGIAYHWKRKLLDDESLWVFFAYWLLPYYVIAEGKISAARSHDPDAFTYLDPMIRSLRSFKSRRHLIPGRSDSLTKEKIVDFLQDEAALFTGTEHSSSRAAD
jgi:hypothetical protein